MKPSLILLTLGIVLTVVTGCGIVTIEGSGMRTLTLQQSWTRVDQHITTTVAALLIAVRAGVAPYPFTESLRRSE